MDVRVEAMSLSFEMSCRSLLSRGTCHALKPQQIDPRMRAYNALNLQALGRGTVQSISKAVILIRYAISNVCPMSFPGGDPGCFVLANGTQISVKKLQTHIAKAHNHVQQKSKTSGFLILGFGFGFDDASLYDKAGASVTRRQCTGGTHTVAL